MTLEEIDDLKAKIYELIDQASQQLSEISLNEWLVVDIEETIHTLNELSNLGEQYLEGMDELTDEEKKIVEDDPSA